MTVAVKSKVTFTQPNPFGIGPDLVFTVKVLTPSKFKPGQIRALVVWPAGVETWTDTRHLVPAGSTQAVQPAPPAAVAVPTKQERKARRAAERYNDADARTETVDGLEMVCGHTVHVQEHFNSIQELAGVIETQGRDGLWTASMFGGRASFYGTADMDEAISLARGTWQEGVNLARDVLRMIKTANPTRKAVSMSVVGGSVDVGRMLSGNPLHMRSRKPAASMRNVTLAVNLCVSGQVEAEYIKVRAAVFAAIVDALEDSGYSVELRGVISSADDVHCAPGKKTGMTQNLSFTLKAAGQPLNVSDVVFGIGHPSVLRRFSFARAAAFRELLPWGEGFGYPCDFVAAAPDTFVTKSMTATGYAGTVALKGGTIPAMINFALNETLSSLREQGLDIEMNEVTA